LSPVWISAQRTSDAVLISWLRRSRLDGDAWEPVEIPLGETSEAYEIDIMNGASVVRTLRSLAPTISYSADQEFADFGAVQPTLQLRIAQMSSIAGRGFESAATVIVT
jgi:hypothetical protein